MEAKADWKQGGETGGECMGLGEYGWWFGGYSLWVVIVNGCKLSHVNYWPLGIVVLLCSWGIQIVLSFRHLELLV